LVELVQGNLQASVAETTRTHLDRCDACQSAVAGVLLGDRQHARSSSSWIGRTLDGRYTIEEKLGAGATAAVFRAHDARLERDVAIKILHAQQRGRAEALSAESKAMASLRHPNVVTVHDVLAEDGHLVVVMEYVRGITLRQWFERGPHRWTAVFDVMMQAAAGLGSANEAGWIHRDFKPDNVLVGEDGRVLVTDFGLARLTTELCQTETLEPDAEPQRTAAVVGTPAYMAPEQWEQVRVDARADVFALCTTFYEGLAGARPFDASNTTAVQQQKLDQTWAKLSRTKVPPAIAAIVESGLSASPQARPASVSALITRLHRARARRRRAWVAAAGLGLLAPVAWMALPGDDPCDTYSEQALWTPDQRTRAQAQWGTSSDWHLVEAALDDFSSRWQDQWRTQCAEEEAHQPRLCLEHQRVWMESTLDMLARGDLPPRRAARAVPAPETCSDGTPLPARSQADHAEGERLRIETLALWEQLTSGEYDAVLEASRSLRERTAALGDLWLQSDIERLRGEALYVVGRTAEARTVLLAATDHATAANHTACLVEAWLVLARVSLDDRADLDLSRDYTTLAEQATQRLGDTPWAASMRVAIQEQRAKIVDYTPDAAEAVRQWETALAMAEKDDPAAILTAQVGLAYALQRNGDVERSLALLRETLAEYERAFPGEQSQFTAILHLNVSAALYASEDYAQALHHSRRAREITLASGGRENDTTVQTRINEVMFLIELGKTDELPRARTQLEAAVEQTPELPEQKRWAATGMLVELAWYLGDDETCAAEHEALLAQPKVDQDDIAVVLARIAASNCLVALGRPDEGVREARAALRSLHRTTPDTLDTNAAHLALAHALLAKGELDPARREAVLASDGLSAPAHAIEARIAWATGDPAQARALARLAAPGLRADPSARRRWTDLQAWARAHDVDLD
jgi:serine/threonine protein kinase/tetratricopeptide (TPR) repeat protein